ncbi:MAG TPA: 2-oxoacid:acceptor oxidoreductase family protein [Candidatus Limnocylindrales bacterium]
MTDDATIFAGFGGQGILFAGTVLARAAMAESQHVLWIPSYGPEMRGGTASCTVIVSDAPIGSPVVDLAAAVIALNPPSLAKFEGSLAPHGLLVLNASLIEAEPSRRDIEVLPVRCTALAKAAGDDRLVSMVALGALLARRRLVDITSARAALKAVVEAKRPEILAADLAALEAGYRAATELPTAPVGV